MIFAFIMALMAIIGTIYGLHVEDEWQHIAAWFYVAGSLGVIYSGDYLVLFLFWEMMAFASTFLIWFNDGQGRPGRRLPLSAGPYLRRGHSAGSASSCATRRPGDLTFVLLDEHNTQLYTWLIMIGLMLNAAVPPLHSWLPDAYSKAYGHRRGVHVRLHHQDRGLHPGPGLCRL